MNTPLFAIIENIYVHDYKKIAICKFLNTEELEWKCNAFPVTRSHGPTICIISNLMNRWPIPMYEVEDKLCVMNRFSHFGQGYL